MEHLPFELDAYLERISLSGAIEPTEGKPYLDALNASFSIELDAPYNAIRPIPSPPPG